MWFDVQKAGFLPALDSQEEVTWVTLEDSQPLPDIDWKILTFIPPPEEDNSRYRKKILFCFIKMQENVNYLHPELMLNYVVIIE